MFHALKTSIVTGIGFAAGSIIVVKAADYIIQNQDNLILHGKVLKAKLKKRFF